MTTKERRQHLANIKIENKYSLILCYDITDRDKEIRDDLKSIIDRYKGQEINESVYGFNDLGFEELKKQILSLKEDIKGNFSNATNFNILQADSTDIFTERIK